MMAPVSTSHGLGEDGAIVSFGLAPLYFDIVGIQVISDPAGVTVVLVQMAGVNVVDAEPTGVAVVHSRGAGVDIVDSVAVGTTVTDSEEAGS